MDDGADGGTDVQVVTDLNVTGKPAQFGRGVMQDVSDKLLGQFVACLEQRLTAGTATTEPETTEPETTEPGTAEPGADEPTATAGAEPTPLADAAAAATASSTQPAAPPRSAPPRSVPPPAPAQDDALDLGAAVLPVLVKGYWKQGLGGLVGLLVVWRLLRR